MKEILTRVFLGVVFSFCTVFSVSAETHHSKPIIVLTVPKSGSHLLWRIVELITEKSSWISDRRGINEQLLVEAASFENSLLRAHILRHSVNLLRNDLDSYIKVLMIRDPRDVLLSQIDWIERSGWFQMPIERVRRFKQGSSRK
jgi:hypothetical protein